MFRVLIVNNEIINNSGEVGDPYLKADIFYKKLIENFEGN